MTKVRLEAFSDGVLAIAITLLALALPTPSSQDHLAAYLSSHWPSYAAYLASFMVIGIIWLNHHALLATAAAVTRTVVVVNLGLLLCVVSIPYATSVLAVYLRGAGWNARVAAAIYSSVTFGMAISFAGLFESLGRASLAADPSRSVEDHVAARRRFTAGVVPYLICVGLSFVSAYAMLALQFGLALYYLFDQIRAAPVAAET
jgi:uncharacterized membrane protein